MDWSHLAQGLPAKRTLFKERQKGWDDEKEDVSSYRFTVRKREEETLDHDGWRIGCERGYGPLVRPTMIHLI